MNSGVAGRYTFWFGGVPASSVGGVLWDDANRNGTRDGGEGVLGGVAVTLTAAGQADRTATTAIDGTYRFDSLSPGAYSVVATAPGGFAFTLPAGGVRAVSLTSGQPVTDADFGLVRTNRPPAAGSDSLTTRFNAPGSVNVLANDTDPDGASLTVASYTQPANGSVAVDSSGLATYTPTAGFFGSDSFTYTAADGQGGTASGTVSVTVTAPLAVTATGPSGNVVRGTPSDFSATASGGAGSGYSYSWDFGDGQTGSGANPSHLYAAAGNFTATVTASLDGETASATVPVYVVEPNRVPQTQSDTLSTRAGRPGSVNVLANDSDPDGDPLTATVATQPANGSVVIDAFGVATFTPSSAAWFGSDSFTYLASDGKGGTTSGSVSVTVSAPLTVTASGTNTVPLGRASTFSATAAGGAGSGYTYSWDFGDGSTDTGIAPSHTYAAKGTFTATVTATDGVETATSTVSVYVTDPLPKVTIAAGIAASEVGNDANGVANGTFVLTRAGGDTSKTLKVTVQFETGGGIADRNADFTAPLQVTFSANQLTATLVVTPKKDNLVEGAESVRATVVAGATYDVGTVGTANLALADDPPVVWIGSGPLTVAEGLGGSVHVNRSGGDLSRPLPVTFVRGADSTNDPLAAWGKDYTLASSVGSFGAQSGRVTFAAGENSADITLSTKQRELTGPNDVRKGFELAVAPGGAGYVAGKAGGPAATDVRIDSRPYPVKQFATTTEGQSVTIPLASVASPGADLSYTVFRGTDAGTVSVAGSMLTFTPATGFSGEATFYVQPHSVVHATTGSVALDGNLSVIRVHVEPAPVVDPVFDPFPAPNEAPEVSLANLLWVVHAGQESGYSATASDPNGAADILLLPHRRFPPFERVPLASRLAPA